MPATFYIVTGALGKPRYLSKAQVRELYHEGHEIGAHTVSHRHLTTLSERALQAELRHSKKRLERLLGCQITHFAPPFGDSNRQVLKAIKRHFTSSRSVEPGYNYQDSLDPFDIRVKNIFATTTMAEVKAYLRHAVKTNAWLVLVYHQIDHSQTPLRVLPDQFEEHLQWIKKYNLKPVTIGQALDSLR